MNKAENAQILDATRRALLDKEQERANLQAIVAMSGGDRGGTHRYALERTDRELVGLQQFAKAVIEAVKRELAGPVEDVAAIMAETHRITHDPALFHRVDGKATVTDDDWWVDHWARQGQFTVALTDRVAALAARGVTVGVDVMGELGPLIKSLRD